MKRCRCIIDRWNQHFSVYYILYSFQKGAAAELAVPYGDEQRLCLPVNLSLLQEGQVQKTWVTGGKDSKRY